MPLLFPLPPLTHIRESCKMKRMKAKHVIFYRGGSCNEQRVLQNLKKLIPEISELIHPCKNFDLDAELAQKAFLLVHEKKADALFSVDYYPILAEVAHTAGIPYLSWIIDAPHYTLYSPTSCYDESYIFHFDLAEAERLTALGRPHVFHQPLAGDPDFFRSVIASAPENKRTKYSSDISFLGSSYQNEHDYFAKQDGLSDYEKGYFDGLIRAQLSVYGASLYHDTLPDPKVELLMKACDLRRPETYDLPESLIAETALDKRVSVLERKEMITTVAEQMGLTLYSHKDDFPLSGVRYAGYADYETEMPLAFAFSRINLNTTLRAIRTGIPLRALDIMACGGFLLSNYQPELLEHFTPGEDMEIYESMEDLIDKCGWYLEHEEERARIARNGLRIVKERFTYEEALNEIFSAL